MTEYSDIKNQKDAEFFMEKCNSLHDGYILSFQYLNQGIDVLEDSIGFDPRKSTIRMQVLVTSLSEKPIVEIVFQGILDWQVLAGMWDIMDCCIAVDEKNVVWADSYTLDLEIMKSNSYVKAESMAWRIVEAIYR